MATDAYIRSRSDEVVGTDDEANDRRFSTSFLPKPGLKGKDYD